MTDKKIIVFCNWASPYEEKNFEAARDHIMKDELKDIPFFYCRGAWNMEAMSFMDRNLCKLLQKAVGNINPKDYELWEAALMEVGQKKTDWTDRA